MVMQQSHALHDHVRTKLRGHGMRSIPRISHAMTRKILLPHRNQIQTPQTPVYFSKRAGNGGRGGRVRGESAPDSSAGSGRNEEICCRGVNV
jgi:hypothetical protein